MVIRQHDFGSLMSSFEAKDTICVDRIIEQRVAVSAKDYLAPTFAVTLKLLQHQRDLLYDCIVPSIGSKEFFLQKAIGWALRQYAWTDPAEIRRYVKKNESSLAPLSKREALKNI